MEEKKIYKVSIGMPVYGVEKYIRKCMLSVLNQSFKEEYEIIMCFDNNEKTSKIESADEKLNPNISSNHSNKIKNITLYINEIIIFIIL